MPIHLGGCSVGHIQSGSAAKDPMTALLTKAGLFSPTAECAACQ